MVNLRFFGMFFKFFCKNFNRTLFYNKISFLFLVLLESYARIFIYLRTRKFQIF